MDKMRSLSSVVLLLLLSFDLASSRVVVAPNNTAVIDGKRLELHCTTDSKSSFRSWTMRRAPTDHDRTIYQFTDSSTHVPPFQVHMDESGTSVLYSNVTHKEEAGIYTCVTWREDTEELETHSAQVIVLETEPVCETNLIMTENGSLPNSSDIWIQCTVRYHGNWAPKMRWIQYDVDENGKQLEKGVRDVTNDDHNVTSSLTYSVSDLYSPTSFACVTYFDSDLSTGPDTDQDKVARNIPEWEYIWRTPVIIPPIPTDTTTAIVTSPLPPTPATAPLLTPVIGQLTTSSGNWVTISVVGAAVGVLGCFLLVILISISWCICVRTRNNAKARRLNSVEYGCNTRDSGAYDPILYDAIDDANVYSEVTTSPMTSSFTPRQAARSMSTPGCSVALPSRGPKNGCQNGKMATMDRGRVGKCTGTNSGSLPNLYTDPTQSKAFPNRCYGDDSDTYLEANEIELQDRRTGAIPSVYLGVNEQSKRDEQVNRTPYLDLCNDYLLPQAE